MCPELGRAHPRPVTNLEALFTDGMGEEIFAFAAKIYPICRNITGNGLRDTLRHIYARSFGDP